MKRPSCAAILLLALTTAIVLFSGPAYADPGGSTPTLSAGTRAGIDYHFEQVIDSLGLAALSACVVRDDHIVWSGAYGYADIEQGVPATTETVFMLASASKLFTGAALLKLCEEGKARLDDDINKYLPYDLRNPRHPDVPITIRMLLTHTSSIKDRRGVVNHLYGNGDSKMTLKYFMHEYFARSGHYYMSGNYHKSAPGKKYHYSNVGFALAGHLVEIISGKVFNEYCRENIFKPLGMNSTGWFLSELGDECIARHYKSGPDGSLTPIPHYGWPGYPDGQLRSSAEQVGRYLIMVMNDGMYENKEVFKAGTIEEMLTKQRLKDLPSVLLPELDLALPWHVSEFDGRAVYAHTGRGSGVCTCVLFDPVTKVGFVLLITGQFDNPDAFHDLGKTLLARGRENS